MDHQWRQHGHSNVLRRLGDCKSYSPCHSLCQRHLETSNALAVEAPHQLFSSLFRNRKTLNEQCGSFSPGSLFALGFQRVIWRYSGEYGSVTEISNSVLLEFSKGQSLGKVSRISRMLGSGSRWIFAAKLLLSLVAIVFATSVSVTSSSYQAEIGSAVNVANGLTATDKGFSLASVASTATSCSVPVIFTVVPG